MGLVEFAIPISHPVETPSSDVCTDCQLGSYGVPLFSAPQAYWPEPSTIWAPKIC